MHSFAVDPRRGGFILMLLALYIGGAMALFALRIGTVREGNKFEVVSREGALVFNNLFLSVILVIVLVGTLYPLGLEAMTGTKISVGAPYFNATAGPAALLLMLGMAAGPMIRWRHDSVRQVMARLSIPVLVLSAILFLLVTFGPKTGLLPLMGLTVSGGIAAASVAPLWKRNLRRTPLFTYGMVIAHLGCAVSLAGMASDSAYSQQSLIAMQPGQSQRIGPYNVTLKDVTEVPGPNWSALDAEMVVRRDGGSPFSMHPQSRTFTDPPMETSESAIQTSWNGQLYLVVGAPNGDTGYPIRMWWKPFVTFIWLGGAMIALGGAFSLLGRIDRDLFSVRKLRFFRRAAT